DLFEHIHFLISFSYRSYLLFTGLLLFIHFTGGFSASCFIKLGIHRIIKISGRQPVNNAIISQNSQMNSFL
ncbi:hypothetical protein, partial [Bacteroides cellulosilyticus]|uniref:hypothetical protein n=1 Tax=Bacteroides cellulosilyticus TaxID=246787 RepID=UPI0032EB602C